jgi:hypothetical protein
MFNDKRIDELDKRLQAVEDAAYIQRRSYYYAGIEMVDLTGTDFSVKDAIVQLIEYLELEKEYVSMSPPIPRHIKLVKKRKKTKTGP